MPYQHKVDNCFSSIIGENGFSPEELSDAIDKTDEIITSLRVKKHSGELTLLSIGEYRSQTNKINEIAKSIRKKFNRVIILGTGGSSLCGQAITGIVESKRKYAQSLPIINFIDNVDPDSFSSLIENIDHKKTFFLVISKSGGTMETLAQFSILLSTIGVDKASSNFLIITDPSDSPLRRLATKYNIKVLDHQPDIGGRFSAFTNVGLLPAAIAGMDIDAIILGAENVILETIESNNNSKSKPAIGAAINYIFMQKGVKSSVIIPYIERLINLTKWYRQIWAESLAKDGLGTTPIQALGTIDQHSQLQLYLDGPSDKLFTFITLTDDEGDIVEKDILCDEALSYLHDKSLGMIMNASAKATQETLILNCSPVRSITLSKLDEQAIGELIMHFMLETIITAELLEINAYDQPAVEEGKLIARRLLSKAI